MEENKDLLSNVVEEIKNTEEEQLREVIEKWFESTRIEAMKMGAYYISAGVYAAIRKNLNKTGKSSLNDYRRCIKDIMKIIEVQLKPNLDDTTTENPDKDLEDET